jgi:hypothetical protein
MAKYRVEYTLETTHEIVVEADSEEHASELANEIDVADWKETDCNTLDYIITDITDEDTNNE